ncbi:MAG: hypothetical protein F6K55_11530 [Moorea sp. SIO4A3]|nr:hypothetical protein [Moorena sp. SIO4A3]
MAWASGCGIGILPVSCHGHLAVEQASCLFHFRTGILPVSFPGRQDAHPTPIHPKIQQC